MNTFYKNENTIESIIAENLDVIKEYGLEKLIYSTLPPEKYISAEKKSVETSIQKLKYDKILQDVFKSIPTRPGSRKSIGKQELIEKVYGLNRYYKEQIEKADFSWMEKAIEEARSSKTPTSVSKMTKLKRKHEEEQKSIERKKRKEAQTAEFAAKVENSKKASSDEKFGAALVDLVFAPEDFDFSSVSLPMAENSLMLMAVRPKDMKKALDILNQWQYSYIDNVIWNRDFSKPGSCWSDNKHTVILIASKGNPEKPMEGFKLNSVHYERQTLETVYIPDYYYDMIEQMCPGLQYLEVFSHRQYSDSWHFFDTNSGNN